LVAVLAVGSAHAGDTLFTFDDGFLASGSGDIGVSLYMSQKAGSPVIVNGAEAHSGSGFGDDLYLWTRFQVINPGNIRIFLTEPVNYVSFDGYVFDATGGADFTFTAYDQNGDVVHQASWNAGVGGIGSYETGMLPTYVYQLNFSDHGRHDIGIDNLRLATIPAPAALMLGSLGMGLVGYLRRRKAL
jgi:hypothetical protein